MSGGSDFDRDLFWQFVVKPTHITTKRQWHFFLMLNILAKPSRRTQDRKKTLVVAQDKPCHKGEARKNNGQYRWRGPSTNNRVCHVILRHRILQHVILRHVILRHIILWHVILPHVILRHVQTGGKIRRITTLRFKIGSAIIPMMCATHYVYFPCQRSLLSMQNTVQIHTAPLVPHFSSGLGKTIIPTDYNVECRNVLC